MSAAPKVVGELELAFFFQTNEPIPARPLLTFIAEVERIALSKRFFGPSAIVEVTEIITGTKLVRLTVNQKIQKQSLHVSMGALLVSAAGLGLNIADRLQKPTGKLAEAAAEMCVENGVVECVVTTSEGQIRVTRDQMPAIKTLKDRRERTAENEAIRQERRSRFTDEMARAPILEPSLEERPVLAAERLSELPQRRDGRVYTVVGFLNPPGSGRRISSKTDGEFRTQSGKLYATRGVDWTMVRSGDEPLVIRARIAGEQDGYTVLDVLDVFEPEEP